MCAILSTWNPCQMHHGIRFLLRPRPPPPQKEQIRKHWTYASWDRGGGTYSWPLTKRLSCSTSFPEFFLILSFASLIVYYYYPQLKFKENLCECVSMWYNATEWKKLGFFLHAIWSWLWSYYRLYQRPYRNTKLFTYDTRIIHTRTHHITKPRNERVKK